MKEGEYVKVKASEVILDALPIIHRIRPELSYVYVTVINISYSTMRINIDGIDGVIPFWMFAEIDPCVHSDKLLWKAIHKRGSQIEILEEPNDESDPSYLEYLEEMLNYWSF